MFMFNFLVFFRIYFTRGRRLEFLNKCTMLEHFLVGANGDPSEGLAFSLVT